MQTIITQEEVKEAVIIKEKPLLKKYQKSHKQVDIFDCIDQEVKDDFLRLKYCFEGIKMIIQMK